MPEIKELLFTTAQTEKDLEGILELQKANLAKNLTPEEAEKEGYVTVDHSLEQLKKLHEKAPHIIAKDGDKVVGYVLAMTSEFKNEIPVLEPMFQLFDGVIYKGKPVSSYTYLVAGQTCVDKDYRGQGVMQKCYTCYKQQFGNKYDLAITDIVTKNVNSVKAHEKTGFREIGNFTSDDGIDWVVVLWDWKSGL